MTVFRWETDALSGNQVPIRVALTRTMGSVATPRAPPNDLSANGVRNGTEVGRPLRPGSDESAGALRTLSDTQLKTGRVVASCPSSIAIDLFAEPTGWGSAFGPPEEQHGGDHQFDPRDVLCLQVFFRV